MSQTLSFDEATAGGVDIYSLDFTTWLSTYPGDAIQTAVVSVAPAGMNLVGAVTIAGALVSQELSGGVSGTEYTISYAITTTLGRVDTQTATVFCGPSGEAPTSILTALGARALRKIGVAMVADASRPGAAPPQTAAAIADDVLRQMGIIIAEADRPAPGGPISVSDIAGRALRDVAINPSLGPWPAAAAASTAAQVASVMLVQMGVTVPLVSQPAPAAAVAEADIATRALEAVGINPGLLADAIGSGITWTYSQVAEGALLKLAVYSPDDASGPTAEDLSYAETSALTVHDMLVATDFVSWAAAAIPNAAYEFYVIMVAQLIGPGFGKPGDPALFTNAQAMIRSQALAGPAGQALALAKVQNVHEELNALGIVSWLISAVPSAEAEHYVRLTALMLAPDYKALTAEDTAAAAKQYAETIVDMQRAALLRGIEVRAASRVVFVHEELNALGFVTWTSDTVPAALVESYAMLAASTMQAEGGKALAAEEFAGVVQRIRMVVLSGQLGLTLAEIKVAAVHDELNALALVSWPLNSIPTAYADYYAALTTSKLWPIFRTGTADERKASLEADVAVLSAIKRSAFVAGALSRATARVNEVHEELNALGLTFWPSTAVPASAAHCYKAMAANMMVAEGGVALTPPQYAGFVQRVRMIAMGGAAGQALAEQKVSAVHYSLEARGLTRWTLFDVPDYAQEPYVLLAATLLAPECFVKADPLWAPAAERDLFRIIQLPSGGEPVRADYF